MTNNTAPGHLKRAIQKYIEDALAEEIVNSKLEEGDTIHMDLDEAKEELTIKIKKGRKVVQNLNWTSIIHVKKE